MCTWGQCLGDSKKWEDWRLGAQCDAGPPMFRQEMMGGLELGPEADVSQLEPLLTLGNIEKLEATFVIKVQVSSQGTERCFVHWLQYLSVESYVYLSLARSVPSCIPSTVPRFLFQASVAQWLQKALDGEVAEWGREEEPNTDASGFYHSPMPAIVLQVGGKVIR